MDPLADGHWVATGGVGGRLGPQVCSLNICFFKVYYVSCRCSGTILCDDSAMLKWQPNKVFYQRNPGFFNT